MFKIMLKDYQRPLLKFASMNIISSQSLNVKPMLKHAKVQKSLEKSIRRLMRSEKETSLKLLQMLENKRKVVSYDNDQVIQKTLAIESSRGLNQSSGLFEDNG